MLEPGVRLLLFEALKPPEGFRFDQGIGTTYTLDLPALLTAPMAFTWFAQESEDQRVGVDSLEILESLRRHADQLTIFCQAGRIALPKKFYPQLAFLETSIVECQPASGGVFHPKVWVLRWINDEGAVRYRMLCLSRNLTFTRAWDTLLALDGDFSPNRRAAVGANRGLVDFVRALPRMANRPIEASLGQRIELLASELERTEFELPDGFSEMRFWPMGIGGRAADPLRSIGDRLLIVAPFITLGRLEGIASRCESVTLVSSADQLARLSRRPENIEKFYVLSERAKLEVDAEEEEKPETEAEGIQQSDLHAKLYVSEKGWNAHIWTGSANATEAAFERNIEFLVELVGPRKRFGIDALMQLEKGEMRFINLLEDGLRFVASEPEDPAVKAMEQKLDRVRGAIAAASLQANVITVDDGTFHIELTCQTDASRRMEEGVTMSCWPATLPTAARVSFERLEPGVIAARFPGLSFQAITSFFAFELTARADGQDRHVRFVLNLPLLGAPEGRREQVLRSLVRDRSRMLRFLWLLLADEGVIVPETARPSGVDGETAGRSAGVAVSGLFEMLLRNLDRAPERLDHLGSLLKELRKGEAGEDLLPHGFDEIWEPIWRQRERLRPGSGA